METRGAPNDNQARYWNGEEAGHWLVHEHRYERMLTPFTDRLLPVRRADARRAAGARRQAREERTIA
jgi:hypothetical protein